MNISSKLFFFSGKKAKNEKLSIFPLSTHPAMFLTDVKKNFLVQNFIPRSPFYVTHHLCKCISSYGFNLVWANEFRRWLELRAWL